MAKIPMTREDLEDILGDRVFDWQWERFQEFFRNGVIRIGINREDLTTDRPDLISVVREELRQNVVDDMIKNNYPASTLKHIRNYLKEHDPEVLDSLFYTRDDGGTEV